MIKRIKIINLNKIITCDINFNPDINIITGRNGSGKTTVLKLIWYAISGNLERIFTEMTFDLFELETDRVFLQMSFSEESKKKFFNIRYRIDGDLLEFKRPIEKILEVDIFEVANRAIYNKTGNTIFFPTFRRIEGGFSLTNPTSDFFPEFFTANSMNVRRYNPGIGRRNELPEAMNALSERLSVGDHRFVASISTDDINRLLTLKYAEISERTNRLHTELATYILKHVHNPSLNIVNNQGQSDPPSATEALEDIRRRARIVSEESDALLRPFTVLSELMTKVFHHKGIKLSGPVTLGEAKNAIASDRLSAGEKQMLSFLCYNAFTDNSCVFIDEPETSLHVDWQRILFTVLLQQSTGNQFIVATHSPFIYAKYADKELILSKDEGSTDANF